MIEYSVYNGDGTVLLKFFGDEIVSDSAKVFMRLRVEVNSLD